ncbi:hypothetical protein C483_03944 [Natrialba hulunbeirensis JCM 10989]|uniref:Uncharacterized protein n=1 Tax=Natrialba hulunbeirensis JCM 10989 TaxID=1227493 RepID=M0A8Y4_9EURY|nr:hypothetical protein C483_03944 [Natrialba hulunbeirensis JCM 10989]
MEMKKEAEQKMQMIESELFSPTDDNFLQPLVLLWVPQLPRALFQRRKKKTENSLLGNGIMIIL